jgi:hypothetical protein
MTGKLRFWQSLLRLHRTDEASNLRSSPHCLERAGHDLGRARAAHLIAGLGLEELGMREDDPELVVEAVEERTQFRRFFHRSPRQERLDAKRSLHQAWFRPSACHVDGNAGRFVLFASRQSVSTKIRTDPPAVLTYSILPLESQL